MTSARRYLLTYLALLALTGLSFAASHAQTGALELPIALLIATAKATLVALFFMHLWRTPFAYKLTLVVAVCFVVIMVALTVLDLMTRPPDPLVPPVLG